MRDCPQGHEGIDGRRLCRARAVNCAPVFRVEVLRGKPDQAQRTGTCGQLPNSISLVSLAFELASLQPPDRQHLSGSGRFCQHTTPEASGARRRQGLKPEGARPGEAAGSTHSAKAEPAFRPGTQRKVWIFKNHTLKRKNDPHHQPDASKTADSTTKRINHCLICSIQPLTTT